MCMWRASPPHNTSTWRMTVCVSLVCEHVCVYAHMHMDTHTYVFIDFHILMYIHVCIYDGLPSECTTTPRKSVYVTLVWVCVRIPMYVYTCIYAYMNIHSCVYIDFYIYVYTCMCMKWASLTAYHYPSKNWVWVTSMWLCMYTCTHVDIYIFGRINTSTHTQHTQTDTHTVCVSLVCDSIRVYAYVDMDNICMGVQIFLHVCTLIYTCVCVYNVPSSH